MRAFLFVCGSLFALLVVVHIVRVIVEPHSARDPWLLGFTTVSAALCVRAWRLAWTTRRS